MYLYKIIIKELLKRNITISVVESCTGGLLSSKFTSVAGISKIFNMGLITYSNKAKSNGMSAFHKPTAAPTLPDFGQDDLDVEALKEIKQIIDVVQNCIIEVYSVGLGAEARLSTFIRYGGRPFLISVPALTHRKYQIAS